MRTNINTIDKQKFVNYILHKNAQELAKDCIRWGKNDWAEKLLQVKLETAESDVLSYVRSDVLSDVLSDVRSDVRSDVLSDVRSDVLSYVLSDVRSDVRSDVLSDVLSYMRSDVRSYVLSDVRSDVLSYMRSDVRSELTKEFIEAYIYAGGKKSALNVKKLDGITLKNIEKSGNDLEQRAWHTCNTTHCRGGWYVVVSKMQELEKIVGTETTASMVALVSTGKIPDFHDMNNNRVLDDIRACAAKE